ncbi:MAG: hypothetical protein ABH952_08375, partial [Candidatus Omnitrophota bacterium]
MKKIVTSRNMKIMFLASILWFVMHSPAIAALKNTHPRLMSEAWIDQLTEWSNDTSWGPWRRFEDFADGNFGDSSDAGRLLAKALMWKMGKDNTYLTECLNKFDSIVNSIGTNINNIDRAVYIAYTYDLLYSELSLAQQKNAVDKFILW